MIDHEHDAGDGEDLAKMNASSRTTQDYDFYDFLMPINSLQRYDFTNQKKRENR